MSERSARLEADGISWGPQKGMPIISGITLSVETGARLAIIGPNGAGKSTLLRCLYRGLKPQRGSVRLDGIDLWSIGPREAAQRIAVVPQETPVIFLQRAGRGVDGPHPAPQRHGTLERSRP